MTLIWKRAFGLACLMAMISGCGRKEEIAEPPVCAAMIAIGPALEVVDVDGAPVVGARVGFTSFDLAPTPPSNDGQCTENPFVTGNGYYSCALTDEQVQIIQQIRDHQRSGTAGISVEKAGYKTGYQEFTDVQYSSGPCWPGGYIPTPNYFKVVLEPVSSLSGN
jgi:hypothetical protein